MQEDFVYKERKMAENELLSLHKRSAISQTEQLQGVSRKELQARQEEILNRKLATSDQYVVNRIDRMSGYARQLLDIQRMQLNRYLAENSDYRSFAQRSEERMMNARGRLGLGALRKTQLGKRKRKMEKKHGVHIRANRIRYEYLGVRKNALKDHMTRVYEEILTKEGREGETYLPEVMVQNPYFEELSDFATWMSGEEAQWSPAKQEERERDLHQLLVNANRFRGSYENGDSGKPEMSIDRQKMLSIYERNIMAVNLEAFDYQSTEEFLEKYRKEYPRLKAFAGAKKILDDLEKTGEQYESRGEANAFRARLETLSEICAHYEAGIKIYDSNCYVLLSRKDLGEKSLRDLEACKARVERNHRGSGNLLQYLEGLTALKKSRGFKMGSSAEQICNEKLKMLKKEEDRQRRLKTRA